MLSFFRRYRLNHCRHILQEGYKHYLKSGKSPILKDKLLALESAIDNGDRKEADRLARDLEAYCKTHYKKSWVKSIIEGAFALFIALLVAVVIRQMWFELYEIPTGSMRPTFLEQDHLTVSKTQFGINIPLMTDHFLFNEADVIRGNPIIFSGDKIPQIDSESPFLGVIPYKKRYVKRLLGKPGDTVFFYGGKIFSKDRKGALNKELLNLPFPEKLEYIPFISFEGQPKAPSQNTIVFSYFDLPLAKVTMNPLGELKGEIFDGKKWVADDVEQGKKEHSGIKTLGDHFGMKNFAMVSLMTSEELKKEGLKTDAKGELYLVIRHTPNLDFSKGESRPARFPKTMTAVLPLDNEEIELLFDNLYTARFTVKNGKASRYHYERQGELKGAPNLANVPDGTYEFYYGKGYEILFGGIRKELPSDHPLMKRSNDRLQTLFNLGINFDEAYVHKLFPTRFAYYRDGDLYVLGALFLNKQDERLLSFTKEELEKEGKGTGYVAFVDRGSPMEHPELIDQFGIKIKDKHYLVLGDNHAMSGDSRVFGFVPEENLQGIPDILIWPPFDRLGRKDSFESPLFVTSRIIVWAIAAVTSSIIYYFYRKRLRRPLKF